MYPTHANGATRAAQTRGDRSQTEGRENGALDSVAFRAAKQGLFASLVLKETFQELL